MNVTCKPLNQLMIMNDRIKQNRPIKDCIKLLRYQTYWLTVCEDMSQFNQYHFEITQQLRAVLTTPLKYNHLPTKQSSLLSESCLYFIKHVFVANEIFTLEQRSLKEQLNQFKDDWVDVNWVVTIKLTDQYENKLEDYLSNLIADQPFKFLLKQVLKKLREDDYPRYQHLARSVFFTRYLRLVQNHFNYQIIFEKNKFVIGICSTRRQINSAIDRLTSVLTVHSECYFSHFSKPLLFKEYAIKRSWKSKKIHVDVPRHMLIKYAHMYQYGDFHNEKAKPRGGLIHKPIPSIHSIYQTELINLATYYRYADNYQILAKIVYFARLSFTKTIALKQGCTFNQAIYLLKQRGIQRLMLHNRRN